jgi:hypothetical protein
MKKRLLLFAAVLTASANFMFAETKTVQDSNGNTFSYDTKTDLDATTNGGDTVFAKAASFDISSDAFKLTLNSDLTMKISNCNLVYNVKLSAISDNPGTIGQFSQRLTSSATVFDVNIKDPEIVTKIKNGRKTIGYSIKQGEAYERYKVACERARAIQANLIYKGDALMRGDFYDTPIDHDDVGGMGLGAEIEPGLYYMVVQGEYVYPIINVGGDYAEGVTYTNSFATYNPVAIADGTQSYTITGDGKVGYVHGVVDDGKVEEILSNTNYTYLNYDFTDVSILGSVATDIIDNRIAYFNKNTDVTGQNIVVGTTCESYVIADNGQEIYVDKSFAAEESKYRRTFTPDSYGTIVLPFTVSSTGNIFVKQAKLTGYVPGPENESEITNKLTFTSTEAIAPNTPYLFKALSTVTGESIFYGETNGTVKATEEAKSANFNGAQFIGTFEGLSAEDASNVYVVGMVGGVGKIGKTKKALKPGRCYFTREGNTNASAFNPTVVFIDEDGSATAIDSVATEETVSVQYLSVNGQISSQPFSGVNIVKKTFKDGSVKTSKVVF